MTEVLILMMAVSGGPAVDAADYRVGRALEQAIEVQLQASQRASDAVHRGWYLPLHEKPEKETRPAGTFRFDLKSTED